MPTKTAKAVARTEQVLRAAYPEGRAETRRLILAQALSAFNARGIEATTIDDLRAASGQSVGTIYHHFKSKEGVVAALLFAAVDDLGRTIAARIDGLEDSHAVVDALITAYVTWITETPDLARFYFTAREVVAGGPFGDELRARTAARYAPIDACFARDVKYGRVMPLPEELIPALVLGAAEWYSRSWLAGRRLASPADRAAVLAEAAWRSIARHI